MADRLPGGVAALSGALVLAALSGGGRWAAIATVAVAVVLPPLLLALSRDGSVTGRRAVAAALAAVLAAGAGAVVLLSGRGEPDGSLPGATWWMLIALCCVPWLITAFGFAASHRERPGE